MFSRIVFLNKVLTSLLLSLFIPSLQETQIVPVDLLICAVALDHFHCQAFSTIPARTGFFSIYRSATNKCGLSKTHE